MDPRAWFHDLRDTAGSIASNKDYAGESAKVVQQLLRHSTQQVTTEVYTHLFATDFDRLRDSLETIYADAFEKVPAAAHLLHEESGDVAALHARPSKKAG